MDRQTLNRHIKDAEIVKCDNCESEEFNQMYQVRKLSAFLSPTGQETYIPIQLFKCAKCNHINKNFTE